MTESPRFDPRGILTRLTQAGVDFVVIGGLAVVLQGHTRTTDDLDIAFAADAENLHALGAVLADLRSTLWGVDEDVPFVADEKTLDGIDILTLDTSLGRLDIHKKPAGVHTYPELRERADRADLDGIEVLVASVDDLIAMKHAAGRERDKVDIAALEEIKRQTT